MTNTNARFDARAPTNSDDRNATNSEIKSADAIGTDMNRCAAIWRRIQLKIVYAGERARKDRKSDTRY